MAVTDAYLSASDYIKRIGGHGQPDAQMDNDLKGISRAIEEETGQFFTVDESVVDRIFYPKWTDRLDLDYEGNCPGIATTTGLVIKVDTDNDGSFADETAWTINTDFRLEPTQAAFGPIARPWDTVRTCGSKSFIPGRATQVTAKFGWPAIPEDVKMLCTTWMQIWRFEGPQGTGRVNELGQVVNISLDVKRLLDKVAGMRAGRITL